MTRTQPVLRLENIHKRYGDAEVRKGVSLELFKGDIKVILGPSGSGKSTLLHCINFLVGLEQGRVLLREQAINPANKPELYAYRQKIGMIYTIWLDEIRFEVVTFTHDERRGASIDAVSFSIPKGARTLLSGPSGSGKTTIINLLLRLYEPASGRVAVDGVDLSSLSRVEWLSRLAVAGQDVDLLEGTIIQNFRLADHDATMDDIRAVCADVEILNEIDSVPEKFDARIGAQGLNFSGGQRQRLGLARALLTNPEFLILDEAVFRRKL